VFPAAPAYQVVPGLQPGPAYQPVPTYPPPYQPMSQQPAPPVRTAPRPDDPAARRAVTLTLVSIGVGAVAMGVSYLLGQDAHLAPATYIRYAMVLTLGVYAVVATLIVTQISPKVRLRWSDGNPVAGVALGLAVGGGLSVLLLALVSAAVGHLDPDPRIVTLMSEGDPAHVVVTVVISCLAAPVIEEVLFRGLLLESQRYRGTGAAIWLSAVAFAVWHLTPSALRYYALLGALLGWLYTRRGLVCSMAAHLGFNGVLTVAALSVVLSAGPTVSMPGVSIPMPTGWSRAGPDELPANLATFGAAEGYRGPSGSAVVVVSLATPTAPTVDELWQRFGTLPFARPGAPGTSLLELQLPSGHAVELKTKFGGHDISVVLVPHDGRSIEIVLDGAGSMKARADFARMLRDLRLS
jgi:membrane protease YdiL (CAAX protease family)